MPVATIHRQTRPDDSPHPRDDEAREPCSDEHITVPVRIRPDPQPSHSQKRLQAVRQAPCCGWLLCLTGDARGRDFRLVPGDNVAGTSSRVQIVLADRFLSRRHFLVTCLGGRFLIGDLGSTNGTYVNGKRVSRTLLRNGDVIIAGTVKLRFVSADEIYD